MNQTLEKKSVVDVLEDRVEEFSSIDHIYRIKNYLLPKMEAFSDKVDFFLEDNEKMKCCIREFDIALCTKCTKATLDLMRIEFENRFIHNDKYLAI